MKEKQQRKIAESIKSELGKDTIVTVNAIRKFPKGPDFIMIYQEIGKSILEGKISLSTSKVFFYLIMHINFENFIGIDQRTLSENIDMPLPTVKKAMKELKDTGMLISVKDNFDQRRNIYRLNPIVAWKGRARNRVKAMKDPAQITMWPKELPLPNETKTKPKIK